MSKEITVGVVAPGPHLWDELPVLCTVTRDWQIGALATLGIPHNASFIIVINMGVAAASISAPPIWDHDTAALHRLAHLTPATFSWYV